MRCLDLLSGFLNFIQTNGGLQKRHADRADYQLQDFFGIPSVVSI